jgi:hypothetical protein
MSPSNSRCAAENEASGWPLRISSIPLSADWRLSCSALTLFGVSEPGGNCRTPREAARNGPRCTRMRRQGAKAHAPPLAGSVRRRLHRSVKERMNSPVRGSEGIARFFPRGSARRGPIAIIRRSCSDSSLATTQRIELLEATGVIICDRHGVWYYSRLRRW